MSPMGRRALVGCGVQASGMCPSAASIPEVGSKPHPPGAGDEGLGPGVQVGEVLRSDR